MPTNLGDNGKTTMNDRIRDEDLSEAKRNELIADYQRIIHDSKTGKRKIEQGLVLFAKGRLAELRRVSDSR